MTLIKVRPGQTIKLSEIDPNDTGRIKSKEEAKDRLADNIERMAELQNVLYAENKHDL
jgi:hypothetical protein